jgi:hypothetical protein
MGAVSECDSSVVWPRFFGQNLISGIESPARIRSDIVAGPSQESAIISTAA